MWNLEVFQKIATLVAQKGFSGAAGVLGLKIVFETNFQAENWLGAAVVGMFLITLAVVIEYLMWREGNALFRERIEKLEGDKRRSDDRLERFDNALLERINPKKEVTQGS